MNPSIMLQYGQGHLTLSLPSQTVFPEYREPDHDITLEKFTRDLDQYLPDDRSRYQRIAIVVSDKTRLCGYPDYLPWLTGVLLNKGAAREHITFYIAYGTHARQTEDESLKAYGASYREFRFVHHDCRDESALQVTGRTNRGTPVTIRKDILESTLIITFGSISHHYFAGFGGGRKLLFPGLASREAIYHNHGLFLDREIRSLAPGCQPGILDGNPLAEDLREIDTYMPSKISVHGIMDATGKVCRLRVGDSYDDFLKACREHDGYYRSGSTDWFDLVIASAGGYPKDINFIQVHKSVHHAAAFVRDGGTLIVLAGCIDGIGSDYFLQFLDAGSFEAAFTLLEKNYEGNGGTALSMMLKTRRIRICMLTSLDEQTCAILGVTKVSEKEIQTLIDAHQGRLAVIRNASMLIR